MNGSLRVCLHFLYPTTARLMAQRWFVKYLMLFSEPSLSCRHAGCTCRCDEEFICGVLSQLKFSHSLPTAGLLQSKFFLTGITALIQSMYLHSCLSYSCASLSLNLVWEFKPNATIKSADISISESFFSNWAKEKNFSFIVRKNCSLTYNKMPSTLDVDGRLLFDFTA